MAKISPKPKARKPKARAGFTALELNILRSKGLAAKQIERLIKAGVRSKADFKQVGDGGTLAELAGLSPEVADRVMAWAVGAQAAAVPAKDKIVVESADVVFCIHCNTKQPKDYKSGDLCVACGKQAEPIMACFWCGATGPGRFCRQCGAEFVPTAELELGILLKRDGVPKNDIPQKLRTMSQADKDVLWGRARRY